MRTPFRYAAISVRQTRPGVVELGYMKIDTGTRMIIPVSLGFLIGDLDGDLPSDEALCIAADLLNAQARQDLEVHAEPPQGR